MTQLNEALVADHTPLLDHDGTFRATLRARGEYNTFNFVLRLSPEVHRKLADAPDGITTSGHVNLETVEAFSTLLHETVHWWQHIGSTYGLMLSMVYPTQSHANHPHLMQLIADVGFKKSIRKLAETLPRGGFGTPAGTANIVINNHFDMESFFGLTVNPIAAQRIVDDKLFECVGHAYQVAYGNIISLLSSVSDRHFSVIPHPKEWSEPFRKLREEKEEGHFYGSPINLYPIGAYEIFEGQARLAQLQYLHFATGGVLGMEVAIQGGMFEGVYGKAFSAFLTLSELDHPPSIDHPTVGLFLLICDLSINPGSGFPFPLVHFPTFLHDIDPGARFVSLARLARLGCPEVLELIQNYSRDEYEEASSKLAAAIFERSPLEIAREFARWAGTDEFAPLMEEHRTYRFAQGNLAVRVLLSHFLDFMRDKNARPEFFCWPGAWMAGNRLASDAKRLFDRHGALYVDKENDDGVFPRIQPDRNEAQLHSVFEQFYAHNVVFDLTRQWTGLPGPFVYPYRWMSQNASESDMRSYAENTFESVFSVRPTDAVIL